MNNRTNKGFALLELLLVVAIIAILVSLVAPIFEGTLNRAKEAACHSNRRSLYVEVVSCVMLDKFDTYSESFAHQYNNAIKLCPSKGEYAWVPDAEGDDSSYFPTLSQLTCTVHTDGYEGGSGEDDPGSSTPVIPLSTGERTNGTILSDESGTCVIVWGFQPWAQRDFTAQQLIDAGVAHSIDIYNIAVITEPQSAGYVKGDVYLVDGHYYYQSAASVNQYQTPPAGQGWIPIQD